MTFNKKCNPHRLKTEIESSAISIAIDDISEKNNITTVTFKAVLSETESGILEALVTAHVDSPMPDGPQMVITDSKKTTSGIDKVSVYEPEGSGATIVSHNYADKCSWYQGSVQVVAGTLSNTGLVYSDPNAKTHWIDLEHGRLYDEDTVMFQTSDKYKVKVFVDSIEVTTGFLIDYVAGTITFSSAPSGVVTASYHYAGTSYFCIRPNVGKVLSIKAAEVQFCQGITLPGAFIFAPWFVGHPVYGTMEIPGQQIKYKNFKDFISACNEGQGLIPAIGELGKDVHVFPFNYARPKPIKYTEYIEIRVYCAGHLPVNYQAGGQYANATFYVTIEDIV